MLNTWLRMLAQYESSSQRRTRGVSGKALTLLVVQRVRVIPRLPLRLVSPIALSLRRIDVVISMMSFEIWRVICQMSI